MSESRDGIARMMAVTGVAALAAAGCGQAQHPSASTAKPYRVADLGPRDATGPDGRLPAALADEKSDTAALAASDRPMRTWRPPQPNPGAELHVSDKQAQ